MEDNIKNIQITKIASIFSYFLIIISLFILLNYTSTSGYELSIYDAYPWYFWLIISTVFLIAVNLSLYQIIFRDTSFDKLDFFYLWSPAIFCYVLILLMPLIRGYTIYGWGDVLTHIGRIQDILTFGYSFDNGYPLSHIFVSILNIFSGISINEILLVLPAFFMILYIFWMIKLSKLYFKEEYFILLAIILVMFLKFQRIEQFAPFTISLFFIPLFFYLFYKKDRSINYAILFVLCIIAIIFYHIFVGVTILIAVLAVLTADKLFNLSYKINNRFKKTNFLKFNPKTIGKSYSFSTVFLIATMVIAWAVYMYLYQVGDVLSWIIYAGGRESTIQANLNILNIANLNLYELVYLTWFRLADTIFFYLAPVFLGIYLVLVYKVKNKFKIDRTAFRILALYSCFFFFTILFSFYQGSFSYDRIMPFVIISSIILIMLIIPFIIKQNYRSKKLFILLALIFSFLMITNVFILHKSPITLEANQQVTKSELSSSKWCLDKFTGERAYTSFNTLDINRFHDAIYGYSSKEKYGFIKDMGGIPDEFGYDNCSTIGESYKEIIKRGNQNNLFNFYMVFSKIDIEYHEVFFKRIWSRTKSFSPESLNKLDNDYTANEIYSNGEDQVWKISV